MDPAALASLLKDGGPYALLALSLLANKFFYDYIITLHGKIEKLNTEWRTDSQYQSDRIVGVLEGKPPEPKRGQR